MTCSGTLRPSKHLAPYPPRPQQGAGPLGHLDAEIFKDPTGTHVKSRAMLARDQLIGGTYLVECLCFRPMYIRESPMD